MAKAVVYLLMWLLLPQVLKIAGVAFSLAYIAFMVCVGIYLLVAGKDRGGNGPHGGNSAPPAVPGESVMHHYVHHVPWPVVNSAYPPAVPSPSVHPARRAPGPDQRPSWVWPSNN